MIASIRPREDHCSNQYSDLTRTAGSGCSQVRVAVKQLRISATVLGALTKKLLLQRKSQNGLLS